MIKKRLYFVKSEHQLALRLSILISQAAHPKDFIIRTCCGLFNCRKISKFLCGEQLKIYCPLLKTYGKRRYGLSLSVKFTNKKWKVHLMLWYTVKFPKRYGFMPFWNMFFDATNLNMLDIMHAMAKKLNKSNIEIFVALCWAIWYSRNN